MEAAMNNPLSHVGQTPHPEVPTYVLKHCAKAQQQGAQSQAQTLPSEQAENQSSREPSNGSWEPPATRLPQHPLQQEEPAQSPNEQGGIPQQGETRAEDTKLPAPTQAD
jgi:hypothetical protein